MDYLNFLRSNARWLLAGFLLTFTSSYGQTFFISVFAGEIRAEFGLSHGAWGGIYTLGTTASALVMIWAGTLADRYRVRQLAVVVLCGLVLACVSMALVPVGWMLIFVIFALRLTGQGMMSHIAMTGTARWFVATRGKAMTIASMGFAAGTALLPIIFVALLGVLAWRSLWMVAAGLALVMIPAIWVLLANERTPQSEAESNSAPGMQHRHWTRVEMLRNPLFWMLVPALLGPAAWGTALFFQQVHLTEVKGWALAEFVALIPLYTLASVITTFLSGFAIDRFGANRLMPVVMVPWVLSFWVLSGADTLAVAAIGLSFAGVGVGFGAVVPGAFLAEHYGTLYLGGIKAAAAAVMVFGSAIGPGISGWVIDFGIDFPGQMVAYSAYFIVAGTMSWIGCRSVRPTLPRATQVNV